MQLIKLVSNDGKSFEVSEKAALLSGTIKDMLEALGEQCTEIPLETVKGTTLEKVVEWTMKWQNESQPTCDEIRNKQAETIDSWNEEFLGKIALPDLYDLVSNKSLAKTSNDEIFIQILGFSR